LFLSTKTVP